MVPLALALAQLDDPACFGALVRSVLLALAAYALLLAGSVWGIDALLADYHWPGWLAGLIGTVGVVALALWLFLPTVVLIATFYIDRIAAAVDARHYPWLPPPTPAPLMAQLWDGLHLAGRVLLMNLAALLLAFLPIPGLGLALAILVSGWAIGRGLFVAVAMRRLPREAAIALYARHRLAVLVPGVVLAAASAVPGVNLPGAGRWDSGDGSRFEPGAGLARTGKCHHFHAHERVCDGLFTRAEGVRAASSRRWATRRRLRKGTRRVQAP